MCINDTYTCTYTEKCTHRCVGTGHFTSRVQVEEIKLSRLYNAELFTAAMARDLARLETRGGRTSPIACIWRWAGRICPYSAIFKN